MNTEIQDFYTIKEFAYKMRVHENTIRRQIKCGKIAAIKFGTDKKGTYRIPHQEIERLILSDLRKAIKETGG